MLHAKHKFVHVPIKISEGFTLPLDSATHSLPGNSVENTAQTGPTSFHPGFPILPVSVRYDQSEKQVARLRQKDSPKVEGDRNMMGFPA